MQLRELLKGVDVIQVVGSEDVDVKDIAYHTKDVNEHCCFVAISGNAVDGHDYVDMAIENGATVVVSNRPTGVPKGTVNVIVENTRKALANMSSRLFGVPSEKLKLIGITGTNGKTTITYLLESIWKECGFSSGVVGTVNYRYGSVLTNPEHTTPESYQLQRLFREMVDAKVTHVAMEVSSHSLDQDRVYGCEFDGGIFTNLTQDHLDYHLDMERYCQAKEKLFNKHLSSSKKENLFAVINFDDSFGRKIAGRLSCRVVGFSMNKDSDVYASRADYSLGGIEMTVSIGDQEIEVSSHLIGKHNASNILGAIAAAHVMGIDSEKIAAGIEALTCVPGRLEPVPNAIGLNVLIDYAHTPDALRNVTTALKDLKPRRLITVFGCGGNRDKTKRPQMGYEAAIHSDLLIVTSDNPRGEHPRKIIDEIVVGVRKVGLEEGQENSGYFVEVDRARAIEKAISLATTEDVVLIAGKGHEDYQIVGQEKFSFDDFDVATKIIKEI